jgi:hypothetical protein
MNLLDLAIGGWRFLGVGAVAGAVVSGGGIWWLRDQMTGHAEVAQVRQVVRTIHDQGATTTRVETRYIQGAERVRTVTRNIVRDVPHVVSVDVDRSYGSLPVGLVRVYNASGEGREVSAVPDPAHRPDAAPSGVLPSTFAAIAADNNGAHNECIAQVNGLQDWIRQQDRLINGGH